jgi:hypothetical protein
MNSGPTPSDGVFRFMADLEEEGCIPARCGDVVRYDVVPAAGRYAGQIVLTGVSVSELQGWPAIPPHWIHLQAEVTFASTNHDSQDCPEGWHRHSRDVGQWVMDRAPILIWLSHARCVIGQAI